MVHMCQKAYDRGQAPFPVPLASKVRSKLTMQDLDLLPRYEGTVVHNRVVVLTLLTTPLQENRAIFLTLSLLISETWEVSILSYSNTELSSPPLQ